MKDERLKDIPVIMMSTNEDTEFVSASLAKGAKNYIIKPLRTAVNKEVLSVDCEATQNVYAFQYKILRY